MSVGKLLTTYIYLVIANIRWKSTRKDIQVLQILSESTKRAYKKFPIEKN